MAIYHATFRITDQATLRPASALIPRIQFDIRTGPGDRARLIEIYGSSNNLTTSDSGLSFSCGRNAAVGTARASGISFSPEDPSAPSTAGGLSIGLDWTTVPTVPTAYMRRVSGQTNNT